jgi:hypothetical protein
MRKEESATELSGEISSSGGLWIFMTIKEAIR